jgi:hypothetical protein
LFDGSAIAVRSEQRKRYRAENADKIRDYERRSYRENRSQARLQRRRYKYGLTAEQALALDAITNCQICGKHVSGKDHQTDHCHETKIVRGVLCGRCNPGLGYFKHDPALLAAAIDYLVAAQKKIAAVAAAGAAPETSKIIPFRAA